jgi:ABC-type nitrate/sulfonate/bicarbonate transport system substrate-binding protein
MAIDAISRRTFMGATGSALIATGLCTPSRPGASTSASSASRPSWGPRGRPAAEGHRHRFRLQPGRGAHGPARQRHREARRHQGKKVGTIKGTSAHFSLFSALKKAKVAPDDLKVVFLDGGTLVPAFTAGDIDAAWIFQPFWYILADKGGRAIVTDRELGIPAIGLWIGREEWLQKNRATCEKFMVALEKAVEARRQHRDAVIQRLSSTIGLTPPIAERLYAGDVLVSLAEQVRDTHPLSITVGPARGLGAFLTSMAEFLVEQKIIASQPDAGAAVDGSFALGALRLLRG